jgi:hypothetical protein
MVYVRQEEGWAMLVRLETDIERRVVGYAERLKIAVLKLNVKGRRGWPDRIFLIPGGCPLFIEFKKPGEKPEPLQEFIHGNLRAAGYRVSVVDNYADGVAAVEAARISAQGSEAPAGAWRGRALYGPGIRED